MPEACAPRSGEPTIAEQLWSESTFAFRTSYLCPGAGQMAMNPIEAQCNGSGEIEGSEGANNGAEHAEMKAVCAAKSLKQWP